MRIFTLTVYLGDGSDAADDLEDCLEVLREKLDESGLEALSGGDAQDIHGTMAVWGIKDMVSEDRGGGQMKRQYAKIDLGTNVIHTQEEKYTQSVDSTVPSGYDYEGMPDLGKVDSKLLTYLQSQLRFWQQREREAQDQVDIWEAALKSARAQMAMQATMPGPQRGGRTAYVRRLIEQSGSAGITPLEIRHHASLDKISLKSNFPYTILAKLKTSQEIRESAGKYFKRSLFSGTTAKVGNDVTGEDQGATNKAGTGER